MNPAVHTRAISSPRVPAMPPARNSSRRWTASRAVAADGKRNGTKCQGHAAADRLDSLAASHVRVDRQGTTEPAGSAVAGRRPGTGDPGQEVGLAHHHFRSDTSPDTVTLRHSTTQTAVTASIIQQIPEARACRKVSRIISEHQGEVRAERSWRAPASSIDRADGRLERPLFACGGIAKE